MSTGQNPKWILPRAFLRNCRSHRRQVRLLDSTGASMTGSAMLLRALIFRKLLLRCVLEQDERFVGLLLPPAAGSVLANVALPLTGRVAVNLNYTVSSEILNSCIRQCGIRHILTSKRFMQRFEHLQLDAELVYLEDLVAEVCAGDKIVAAMQAYVLPLPMLERTLGLDKIRPDDVLTVLFTSGSTGEPKGVMLSHRNVASNVYAINDSVNLTTDDVAIGVLPFFHSYGYTATMWTMLALPPAAIYHFNPLEPKVVGDLCRKHRVSIFMATPTFLRTYLRRCQPEDFRTLDLVFASAEKMPRELADAFTAKFDVEPQEAYGATEMSPLIAVNVPTSRSSDRTRPTSREGSVGRPIPGLEVKVIDPDTGQQLSSEEPGMIWVRGAGVMAGYLNQPEQTANVVQDGWYKTGDIGYVDRDGFLFITGRLSRFSKIGGEMVPHIKIEETIARVLGAETDELQAVVTALPDSKRGERLVVLHTPMDRSPQEICRSLAETDLPKLWIPSADSFFSVAEIPVLGSGKLDLRAIRELAEEQTMATAG